MNYHLKHCCRPNELYLRQPNEHATLQKLLRKGSKNMWKSPRHSHSLQTPLLLIQPNISRVCWNKLDPCNLQEPKDVIPVFLDQPPEETPRDLTFSPQQSCLGITKVTYKILTRWYKNSGWTVCYITKCKIIVYRLQVQYSSIFYCFFLWWTVFRHQILIFFVFKLNLAVPVSSTTPLWITLKNPSSCSWAKTHKPQP